MDEALLENLVLGLAILIGFLSLYGVLAPARLANSVSGLWDKPWSLALAVIVRLLLGLVLLAVAEASRFPTVFQVIGWASLLAAVILPLAGKRRVGRIIEWGSHLPPMAMRAWCLVGVALAALLAYGVL